MGGSRAADRTALCLMLCCAAVQSGLINQFPFDPAGMNSKDMAVKELKNGRLAMVSRARRGEAAAAARGGAWRACLACSAAWLQLTGQQCACDQPRGAVVCGWVQQS